MTASIVVKSGARLHFGFFSCKPAVGRQFGGAGVMIDSLGFEIGVRRASEFHYEGSSVWRERVEKLAARLELASRSASSLSFAVEMRREIPAHRGLGSGTQLGMALASAVALLNGEENIAVETLAQRVARGARSALGIHGFARGGFLIDEGKESEDAIGTLAARVEFPVEWRFVLIAPMAQTGLADADELQAFRRLPSMPPETTARLHDLAHSHMLPAVREAQFEQCAESIYEFGKIVGDYFAPVQGGAYATRETERLVSELRARGFRGVGQTSWGPTIFALCESQSVAESLARDLEQSATWETHIAQAKNTGAQVAIR